MINQVQSFFHRHRFHRHCFYHHRFHHYKVSMVSMKNSITTNYDQYSLLFLPVALVLTLLTEGNTSFAATSTNPTQQPEKVTAPPFTLKPYSATYKATIKGVPFGGSGERSLTKNADGTWTLEFSADAAFFGIKQTSHFTRKGSQLISSQYVQQRTGLGKKPTEYAAFDWSGNRVNWQQGDKQWSMNLKPATLDNLSYQLKLRMDLASANGQPLRYDIADDNRIYQRKFIIEGEEILKTDLGNLKTVRVNILRDSDQRATWIWFAKNHDYFLVKLLQEEKGTAYTIEIKEASIDGKPLKKKQTTTLPEQAEHP
ncbi:DUF3108 domain-containing protein [Endozoicomonas sp. SCSIO W0465]|uniref:DUF3108 domain-containing protein n=1 Tax=Endozoicomonas sp. SCSIO W0465 TaxID=2918516 RepID=UPI002076627B|nr:DUF3108 domain-containing protein [Endozoicomonas sp. SCSIO W0465]USE34526.1 DUF3108 domain-containing protein [Endozoicomonas sp. SCSIO W0465]